MSDRAAFGLRAEEVIVVGIILHAFILAEAGASTLLACLLSSGLLRGLFARERLNKASLDLQLSLVAYLSTGLLDGGHMILVHVSEVVEVAILLRHGDQVAVLHRCLLRSLREELGVHIGNIRSALSLRHERRRNLFVIEHIPVNLAEPRVLLELLDATIRTAPNAIRRILSQYLLEKVTYLD